MVTPLHFQFLIKGYTRTTATNWLHI